MAVSWEYCNCVITSTTIMCPIATTRHEQRLSHSDEICSSICMSMWLQPLTHEYFVCSYQNEIEFCVTSTDQNIMISKISTKLHAMTLIESTEILTSFLNPNQLISMSKSCAVQLKQCQCLTSNVHRKIFCNENHFAKTQFLSLILYYINEYSPFCLVCYWYSSFKAKK